VPGGERCVVIVQGGRDDAAQPKPSGPLAEAPAA
jgi:hypothetical protein